MKDSFKCIKQIEDKAGKKYKYCDLSQFKIDRLPFSLKVLLENLLRTENGSGVTTKDIDALLKWSPKTPSTHEIAFTPARVILQDFTGVPSIVDLAAMRDAMADLGGDPEKINPLSPVDLVIDHSVMVDFYGTEGAYKKNTALEVERNKERYSFLKWGQQAFQNFRVVPPGTGIVHQVNLEYLGQVIFTSKDKDGAMWAYPDTLVGTDSHTTMINGLGILGWGVGGIEAEAAMLGQPITMLIPEVLGFKITGKLPAGTTATDLVLTVTEMLRRKGVVGKFVEFYGPGLDNLTLADRATISNMSPEYGATCAIFPIDNETLQFLKLTGRSPEHVDLVEKITKAQGIFRTSDTTEAEYSEHVHLDLGEVESCLAGPRRPQDKVPLKIANTKLEESLSKEQNIDLKQAPVAVEDKKNKFNLEHGHVVIAAITSCTNTSNPEVMLAAGLMAKKAYELGLNSKPWVKTSLAPGSQVVTDYLIAANLLHYLDKLGFSLVGYGCTTCIGNSGPLDEPISQAIQKNNILTCAVLSGNRNFEGRIHPDVRYSYLASPPLVVAYAIAGTMNINLTTDPLGKDKNGNPVMLKDLWPDQKEVRSLISQDVKVEMFHKRYDAVFDGDENWTSLKVPSGSRFAWDKKSTYIQNPPYFVGMKLEPPKVQSIKDAYVLVMLGDSITTDHISPAGSISPSSPAGKYLLSLGVEPKDFNSYGSRRGNHEIMVRGTFANIRLKNQLAPGTEGSWTVHFPTGNKMSIYDASMQYQKDKQPLIVIAGAEYGSGSSRDWAGKEPSLLGVRAVIAKSFERIHRSNLIGMGILPLQFKENEDATTLQLKGDEQYSIDLTNLAPHQELTVTAKSKSNERSFKTLVRIDAPKELEYYNNGGILPYVLRQLMH